MTSDALRRYRDELVSKERLVGELRKEIQTLRIMEKRQSKAIKELEQEKGNLPRVVQTITEENRVIKEKLREFQSKYSTDEKILAEQHEEIVRLKQNVKEQQQVMKVSFYPFLTSFDIFCRQRNWTVLLLERKPKRN